MKTEKLFKLAKEKLNKLPKEQQVKEIQSMAEGSEYDITIDAFLSGNRLGGDTIDGLSNAYQTYTTQLNETYKKYNGNSDYGNDMVRSIVDIRSSFIAGEGAKTTYGEKVTDNQKDFINKFIKYNNLNTYRTTDIAKRTEMAGHCITYLKIKKKNDILNIPKVILIPNYRGGNFFKPEYEDSFDEDSLKGFSKKVGEEYVDAKLKNFVYFRTGGDGCDLSNTTTKIGIVLTECENYDRALSDIRTLNYKCTRITPAFKTKNGQETKAVTSWLASGKWAIGKIFVGTADFDYKVPSSTAHNNLQIEMSAMVKTICGVTSVPIHWVGHVDLMSNRATASELFSLVNNGTICERRIIQEGIKKLCIQAQEMYIDAGGGDLLKDGFTDDFEITIPMLDFGRLEEMAKANSILYNDDVFGIETYRARTQGVDPVFEKEAQETKDNQEPVTKTVIDKKEIGEKDNE